MLAIVADGRPLLNSGPDCHALDQEEGGVANAVQQTQAPSLAG